MGHYTSRFSKMKTLFAVVALATVALVSCMPGDNEECGAFLTAAIPCLMGHLCNMPPPSTNDTSPFKGLCEDLAESTKKHRETEGTAEDEVEMGPWAQFYMDAAACFENVEESCMIPPMEGDGDMARRGKKGKKPGKGGSGGGGDSGEGGK